MEAFRVKNGLQAGRYLGSNGVETAGSVGYDLAGASYDSVSFSVTGQDLYTQGLTFKPDGTKVYALGLQNNTLYQYSLSTAWDVSTASYDSVSFSFNSQDASPRSIVFSNDGTSLFMVGTGTDTVYQYSLSTAYDASTLSYASKSFSVASQETTPFGLALNTNGTTMFIVGIESDTVYQYSLSTAYDVSTASYASLSFSVGSLFTQPRQIVFNSDGSKFYIIGVSNSDNIQQYSLSTSYDVSTASYDNVGFDPSSQEPAVYDMFFSSDGSKLYVIGDNNSTIYQYSAASYTQTLDLSTGTTFSFTPSGATTVSFTNPPATGNAIGFSLEVIGDGSAITWPTSVKWHLATAPTATASKELYAFVTTDGGTTYYGRKAAEDIA